MSMYALTLSWLLSAPELWAGHQVVRGRAHVPLVGDLPTCVESFLLAEVERRPTALALTVRVCRVAMAPVGPLRASIDVARARRLPPVVATLAPAAAGRWQGSWLSRWRADDEDGDGHPGVSVHVDVPACGGDVYVSSRSLTHADARVEDGGLEATLQVSFAQQQLGASNFCLRLGGSRVHDTLRGAVRFARVPAGSSCASLDAGAWPVPLPPHS